MIHNPSRLTTSQVCAQSVREIDFILAQGNHCSIPKVKRHYLFFQILVRTPWIAWRASSQRASIFCWSSHKQDTCLIAFLTSPINGWVVIKLLCGRLLEDPVVLIEPILVFPGPWSLSLTLPSLQQLLWTGSSCPLEVSYPSYSETSASGCSSLIYLDS